MKRGSTLQLSAGLTARELIKQDERLFPGALVPRSGTENLTEVIWWGQTCGVIPGRTEGAGAQRPPGTALP